jgi:hypothetical protein
MYAKPLVIFIALSSVLLFSRAVQSQTYYESRGGFQNANPGLAFEDFNNAVVAPDGICSGPGPWSASSAASCFEVGGLLEGASYYVSGDPTAALDVVGPAYPAPNLTSPALRASDFSDVLTIDFQDPENNAFGLDIFCDGFFPTLEIRLFGVGGEIASQPWPCDIAGPIFFGVDAGERIVRAEILSSGFGLIDNLEYTFGPPTPRPARATFAVWKDFNDDNPAEVRVTLSCNTGLPLE